MLEHGDITLVTIVPPSGYAEEMKAAAEALPQPLLPPQQAAADAPPAPTGAPGATPARRGRGTREEVSAAPESRPCAEHGRTGS